MQGYIGGTRNFAYPEKVVQASEPVFLSGLQMRIIRLIPFFPEEIRVAELARTLSFNTEAMYSRLASCSFHGLIAEDEGKVTRLRRDLSNVG